MTLPTSLSATSSSITPSSNCSTKTSPGASTSDFAISSIRTRTSPAGSVMVCNSHCGNESNVPQGLKPGGMMDVYRSAEALRHPKPALRQNQRPRRRSPLAPEPQSSRPACSPAPTSARPLTPSTRRERASVRCWRGWCGGCRSRPLPPDGRCARVLSQSPQCDSAAVCAHLRAPDESLTRDDYPCSGRVRRDQDKLLLCRSLGGMARVRSAPSRVSALRLASLRWWRPLVQGRIIPGFEGYTLLHSASDRHTQMLG